MDSPPIWDRSVDSVYHLSRLFFTSLHIVTYFSWYIVGVVWDLIVSVPDRCSLQFLLQPAIAAMHGPHSVFDIGHCTAIHRDAGSVSLVDQ